jgi:hypothetical protein
MAYLSSLVVIYLALRALMMNLLVRLLTRVFLPFAS